jgi:hypothetical protein
VEGWARLFRKPRYALRLSGSKVAPGLRSPTTGGQFEDLSRAPNRRILLFLGRSAPH